MKWRTKLEGDWLLNLDPGSEVDKVEKAGANVLVPPCGSREPGGRGTKEDWG